MKKILFICMICSAVLLSACSSEKTNDKKLDTEDFSKKITNKETFVLYVTMSESSCYTCTLYQENLTVIMSETPFSIFHIILNKESADSILELEKILGKVELIPSTYYIKDGKIDQKIDDVSYLELEAYRSWLIDMGIFP